MATPPLSAQDLPPVPSAQTLDNKGSLISQPWQQWFVNLRDKVNVINAVLVSISGASSVSEVFNTISPLTTNGDLLTYNSGSNIRLPIGTNGQILSVVAGLPAWVNAGAGSSPLTTKGDIYTYSTTDARLPIGTDGYVLTADSTQPTGLSWKSSGGSSPNYDTTVLSDSPVGYWKLSDTSGTTCVDSSTNVNNGTYSGTYTFLGVNGPANLNGGVIFSSGKVTIPAIAAYNLSTFSIEAWFTLLSSTGSNAPCFLSELYTGGTNSVSYFLGINVDRAAVGVIEGGYYTGSAFSVVKGFSLSLNTLYQAVVTYDGTTLRLYINGYLFTSAAAGGHVASNDGLIIAVDDAGSASNFPGVISSISLYSTALSPSRVKAHYIAGH